VAIELFGLAVFEDYDVAFRGITAKSLLVVQTTFAIFYLDIFVSDLQRCFQLWK